MDTLYGKIVTSTCASRYSSRELPTTIPTNHLILPLCKFQSLNRLKWLVLTLPHFCDQIEVDLHTRHLNLLVGWKPPSNLITNYSQSPQNFLLLFAFYLPPLVSGVVSVRQIFKDRFGFLIRTNGRVAEAGNKKALHCVGTRWVGCSKHFALIEAATLD